jgi:hypothetical protein
VECVGLENAGRGRQTRMNFLARHSFSVSSIVTPPAIFTSNEPLKMTWLGDGDSARKIVVVLRNYGLYFLFLIHLAKRLFVLGCENN